MIFGPAGLTHICADKEAKVEDVLCVGRSEHFDSSIDFMEEGADKNLRIRGEK